MKQNVLAIQPTGSGKSLAFLLLAKIKIYSTVVVVVPLLSLISDLIRRCKLAKINVCDSFQSYNSTIQIILVTPEHFVIESSIKKLQELQFQNKLLKVFVDECHLAVSESEFRPDYIKVASICRALNDQVVLLTGTASRDMEAGLKSLFFSNSATVITCRSSSNRLNIQYSVVPLAIPLHIELRKQLEEVLNDATGKSRGLIYCVSKNDLEKIQTILGSLSSIYHGDLSNEEKSTNFNSWYTGQTKILIGTKAFGVGIDFDRVIIVINYGIPNSFEEFSQQSGRAGRLPGLKAKSIIIFDEQVEIQKVRYLQCSGDNARVKDYISVRDYVLDKSTCRRVLLSNIFDSELSICIGDASICDNCTRHPRDSIISCSSPVRSVVGTTNEAVTPNLEKESVSNEFREGIPCKLSTINQLDDFISTPLKRIKNYIPAPLIESKSPFRSFLKPSELIQSFSTSPLVVRTTNLTSFAQTLKDCLDIAKSGKICIVCSYQERRRVSHFGLLNQCKRKHGCFVCYNIGHGRSTCKYSSRDKELVLSGTHVCCKLPISLEGIIFHDKTVNFRCCYEDLIVVLLRLCRADESMPPEQFQKLLTKDDNGHYHCWKYFVEFVRKYQI